MFFLGDIALMLELFGFCLALVLLHRGTSEGGLVRAAGVILLIGSIVLILCTGMGMYKRRAFLDKENLEHMMKELTEMKK